METAVMDAKETEDGLIHASKLLWDTNVRSVLESVIN